MGASSFPPHLLSLLSSPATGTDSATDALEEWILHRRAKGDTLFDVSVGLAELEDRTPPHLTAAFDRARYVTNVPQPSDLTPPMGPFPLARSASSATVLHHLLSQPPPSLEHSREVILEFVLAREMKLREKKPGKGGKGTLGRDGFEDIGKRLGEIEAGLRGESSSGFSPKGHASSLSSSSREAYPTPSSDRDLSLDENQQIGLTLLLSLRMSLSYFTLQELAGQLLLLALGDAERTLVQHIRRRIPGEGRWGVGKELEFVESLTLPRRPALRPAFRSAKARTQLPGKPLYPIQLPAPSKSSVIKLIQSLAKEVESGGPMAAAGYMNSYFPANFTISSPAAYSPSAERSHFMSKKATASPTTNPAYLSGSPQTPISSLPPALSTPSSKTPQPDSDILANYTMELVSEFITREKREHILKSKWAKSGRDQLGKEIGDVESSLCMASKNTPSSLAPTLIPIFLLLRRTFALPRSPLPPAITEPYLDILPAPPDPDNVPFREPTVQTTTASLYVNPRLDDAAAAVVLEELIEYERETAEASGSSREDTVSWLVNLVDSVQKRFPDGSYENVFSSIKQQIARPPQISPIAVQSISFVKQPSVHRRAKSNAATPVSETGSPPHLTTPQSIASRQQHSRSFSMPDRRSTYDESDSSDSDSDEPPSQAQIQQNRPAVITSMKQLPPLQMLSPMDMEEKRSSAGTSGGGWWDIVSAMDNDNPAPWQDARPIPIRQRTSSGAASLDLPLPPGAEAAQVLDFSTPMLTDMDRLDLSPPTPPRQMAARHSPSSSSPGQRSKTVELAKTGLAYSPSRTNGPSTAGPSGLGTYFPEERLPPPPLRFDVPMASSPNRSVGGASTPLQNSPNQTMTPSSATSSAPPPRSKLGVIGRSMSLMHKKEKEKEKARDKENEKSGGKKSKVQNDPGKWDRSMVANIMGAPADKK
ncbi:uncharacterized protein I303_107890 [Kwoniella dejecticola CBS 10117]|uniref:Uncharacterized protein n=1 Tax=Kwoniella dejecticola CBS 10117 TaxID=1296121 RepID=A0A1A5ZVZ9_9TREE|nr:uncharacterized protein I303_07892 [Kwoniella dejecticola CBS 10117]OBR81979.1 hypothetical protein I303_07892 [Kwoniella dejecticola CBS 10117]